MSEMRSASLVSVIIPAYNAEAFIEQTLKSVLVQTYQNFEIIVADDGSHDRTAEIVRAIAQHDSRIYLVQQANGGIAAARNLAIHHARGMYIAPLDADDIWYPEKLEKQVQCMESAEPSVGLVYAWSNYIDQAGNVLDQYPVDRLGNPEGEVLAALIFANFLDNGSNPLIRRSCIDHVGSYNSQLTACEDWDFYLRIAEHYQFRVVPEYLIGYRQYLGSMATNSVRMEKFYHLVMTEIQRRHPEIPAPIYSWAKSSFYNYLLGKSYISGDYRSALDWLIKGVIADPILLTRPGIYQVLTIGTLKLLAQPVTTLIWKDHQAWMHFRQRSQRQPESSTSANSLPPSPKQRRKSVWKPYDVLFLWRWQTVMRMNQELAHQKLPTSASATPIESRMNS
jgi:glycosyltransferase involved in cell wall biosynthesis